MRTLACGLVGVLSLVGVAGAGEWTIEELGEVGMYSDLAVTADGVPHVALCGGGPSVGQVLHATRGSRGWTRTQVAAFGGRALAGQVAIAMAGESPAILFASEQVELWARGREGWARVATWDTWQGNGECQLVLAFARKDPVAFVYDPYKEPAIQVAEGKRLKATALATKAKQGGGLAVLDGTPYAVWQQDTEDFDDPVVVAPYRQAPTAVVANSVVRPRVAAGGGVLAVLSATRAGSDEALVVHTLRDGAWQAGPSLKLDVDQGPWFALGPDGAPHVLCTVKEGAGYVVTYATLGAEGWKTSAVEALQGTRMALQVDGQGRPHVIFANQQSSALFYATPAGELSFAARPAVGARPGWEAAGAQGGDAKAGGGGDAQPGRGGARGGDTQGEAGGARGAGDDARADAGGDAKAGAGGDAKADAGGDAKAGAGGDARAGAGGDAKAGAGGDAKAKPAQPAPQPLTGEEAEAVAREVRQRAERWLALREADKLFCRDCAGAATQRCKLCRGTLKVVCPACRGEGRIPRPKALGEKQRYDNCDACRRKGELKCEACDKGLQACDGCEETPGYRALAANRAFWRYLGGKVRNGTDRDAFLAALLTGDRLAQVVGRAPAIQSARVERVDVFPNEAVVVARVVWAGDEAEAEAEYRTTWYLEDGRFYLATGVEDRPPLIDPRGRRAPTQADDEEERDGDTPARPDAPTPAEQTLSLAANYVQNGAYSAALRKLESLDRATLTPAQQTRYDELLVACRAKLGR